MDGVGIVNSTNLGIPNDLIRDVYFTDIYNQNGSLLHFSRTYIYDNDKNAVIFNICDKVQTANTYLVLTLINGVQLRTKRTREVIVS